MKYVAPTIWLRRTEHASDQCYFCMSKLKSFGFRHNTREKIDNADVESVILARVRSEDYPTAPSENICEEKADFNDLVHDANLSRTTAELVASRLRQWNLVADDFKITANRKRNICMSFDKYFASHEDSEKNLAYCEDVDALFEEIGHPHISEEWRLFIDSSVNSLKVVLLHIGNKYPSVPIAYATNMPENYDNIKLILELIHYNQHEWKICCDLKVVGLLTGRKTELHYTDFTWEPRINCQLGQLSIENLPLVDARKVIFPPLHIKLGLIRNFVRALDSSGEAFKFLHTVFPKLSTEKIKAVVNGFVAVVDNFLGNKKADNYKEIVAEMISAFDDMKVHMSLKIHFLHAHLDYFPPNLGDFSDEHGERFHQDILTIEKRFKGKDVRHLLDEYCWSIVRDSEAIYNRQTKRPKFYSNILNDSENVWVKVRTELQQNTPNEPNVLLLLRRMHQTFLWKFVLFVSICCVRRVPVNKVVFVRMNADDVIIAAAIGGEKKLSRRLFLRIFGLLRDLDHLENLQNFTRMPAEDFKNLIRLVSPEIATQLRKAIPFQDRLAITLRF
ncbi:unnamed protein product [Brassicogethes aeneus]|uniref:Uncharacterized protein n=1 Tax=Brassicogethes aeneus TaxID=1431903 RepID=A0A9P0AQX2_BRAAE|nr:unnamed protein product [Brassicogethes aeneus]